MLKRLLLCSAVSLLLISGTYAADMNNSLSVPIANTPLMPMATPSAPILNAKGYVLLDASSGKILASQNPDLKIPPASLTKMMTSYIISAAIREGRVKLDDQVRISEKAWRTGGSKMFVKIGTMVSVRDLMQGIIVDSGNDACVAMAEHVAGSEDAFASLMNQQAIALGMTGTHFTDSTGLPDPQHFTTAHDMGVLARALVSNFPEDYKWYSQKWFIYNGIKQPNRNRLLWRDPTVDGIKTGHTEEAGFCLVSSALRNGTRMITVVMGAPTDSARAEDSQRLLNYGFRFFETHKLYAAGAVLSKARVWQGQEREVPIGMLQDLYVTVMPGQYANLKAELAINPGIKAPIKKGQPLGTINLILKGEKISSAPLVALQADPQGGFITWIMDSITLAIKHLFNQTV